MWNNPTLADGIPEFPFRRNEKFRLLSGPLHVRGDNAEVRIQAITAD